MISIFLLHRAGQDRESLAGFLTKTGCHVSAFDNLDDLRSRVAAGAGGADPPVVVIHEATLPADRDLAFLDALPLLVLGRQHRLPERSAMIRLDDPYFLNVVAQQIGQLHGLSKSGPTTMLEVPEEEAPVNPAPATRPGIDQGLMLRGIAHALSNPLSAASGWLQLLAVDLGEGDPRRRALNQVRAELGRMEKLIQALGVVGGRPRNLRAPLDLESLVRERVNTLDREGLPTTLDIGRTPLPSIEGDPSEFGLMLDLLLLSFLEERSRVKHIRIAVARDAGSLVMTLSEDGGTLPGGCDPSDIGLLLRRMRHTRAIGIALAQQLVGTRLGGRVTFESKVGTNAELRIRIPVAREAEEAGQ